MYVYVESMCLHVCVCVSYSVGLGTKLGLMFWGYASNMIKSPGLYPLGNPLFHSTLSLGKASPPFKTKTLKSHLHSTNPLIQSNTLSPKILTPDMVPGHTCI